MRHPRLSAALLVIPATILLVSACAQDDPTFVSTDLLTPNLAKTDQTVPFKGACETSFEAELIHGGPNLNVIVNGTCQIAHLGRTAFYVEQVADFMNGTLSGFTVFTAANGDELHATHTGPLTPPDGALQQVDVILSFTGGTGRFEHATGTAHGTGVANLATGTGLLENDGRISY